MSTTTLTASQECITASSLACSLNGPGCMTGLYLQRTCEDIEGIRANLVSIKGILNQLAYEEGERGESIEQIQQPINPTDFYDNKILAYWGPGIDEQIRGIKSVVESISKLLKQL